MPAGVRDPHGLAHPHAAHARALADDRARVGREREHPVQRARRVARAACGRQAPGTSAPPPPRRDRSPPGVNGISEGCIAPPRRAEPRLRRHDRLVAVVADAEVVLALSEVQRHVLVPHDRLLEPSRSPLQLRDRVGPYQLVLHGDQRDRHAGHRADRRAPDAGAQQHALALDTALRPSRTACTRPPRDVEPGDGDAALERDAGRLGARARAPSTICTALARRRRSAPSSRRGPSRGRAAASARRTRRARAARCPRSRRTARTPGGVSAPPCARRWSRPRGRRPRTRPARRRPRARRRARPSPARCGTSCASRWSGR